MKHPFTPVIPPDARVLILGSFPSPASRSDGFYYGHPRNAFWKILSKLTGSDFMRASREEKIRLLFTLRIALWDAFAEAEPVGSSDARLRRTRLNDFSILPQSIRLVMYNGQRAAHAQRALHHVLPHAEHAVMPSTSPAHTVSFEEKLRAWKRLCAYISCHDDSLNRP